MNVPYTPEVNAAVTLFYRRYAKAMSLTKNPASIRMLDTIRDNFHHQLMTNGTGLQLLAQEAIDAIHHQLNNDVELIETDTAVFPLLDTFYLQMKSQAVMDMDRFVNSDLFRPKSASLYEALSYAFFKTYPDEEQLTRVLLHASNDAALARQIFEQVYKVYAKESDRRAQSDAAFAHSGDRTGLGGGQLGSSTVRENHSIVKAAAEEASRQAQQSAPTQEDRPLPARADLTLAVREVADFAAKPKSETNGAPKKSIASISFDTCAGWTGQIAVFLSERADGTVQQLHESIGKLFPAVEHIYYYDMQGEAAETFGDSVLTCLNSMQEKNKQEGVEDKPFLSIVVFPAAKSMLPSDQLEFDRVADRAEAISEVLHRMDCANVMLADKVLLSYPAESARDLAGVVALLQAHGKVRFMHYKEEIDNTKAPSVNVHFGVLGALANTDSHEGATSAMPDRSVGESDIGYGSQRVPVQLSEHAKSLLDDPKTHANLHRLRDYMEGRPVTARTFGEVEKRDIPGRAFEGEIATGMRVVQRGYVQGTRKLAKSLLTSDNKGDAAVNLQEYKGVVVVHYIGEDDLRRVVDRSEQIKAAVPKATMVGNPLGGVMPGDLDNAMVEVLADSWVQNVITNAEEQKIVHVVVLPEGEEVAILGGDTFIHIANESLAEYVKAATDAIQQRFVDSHFLIFSDIQFKTEGLIANNLGYLLLKAYGAVPLSTPEEVTASIAAIPPIPGFAVNESQEQQMNVRGDTDIDPEIFKQPIMEGYAIPENQVTDGPVAPQGIEIDLHSPTKQAIDKFEGVVVLHIIGDSRDESRAAKAMAIIQMFSVNVGVRTVDYSNTSILNSDAFLEGSLSDLRSQHGNDRMIHLVLVPQGIVVMDSDLPKGENSLYIRDPITGSELLCKYVANIHGCLETLGIKSRVIDHMLFNQIRHLEFTIATHIRNLDERAEAGARLTRIKPGAGTLVNPTAQAMLNERFGNKLTDDHGGSGVVVAITEPTEEEAQADFMKREASESGVVVGTVDIRTYPINMADLEPEDRERMEQDPALKVALEHMANVRENVVAVTEQYLKSLPDEDRVKVGKMLLDCVTMADAVQQLVERGIISNDE